MCRCLRARPRRAANGADLMLALSFFLHMIATVVWIGGLFVLTILFWPETRALAERSEQGAVLLDLLDRVRKRFYPLTNFSLVVLIGTGLFQMEQNPHYDGLFQL